MVIANDVDGWPGKLEQLAATLEMSRHLPNISSWTLLVRWKKEMEKLNVPPSSSPHSLPEVCGHGLDHSQVRHANVITNL